MSETLNKVKAQCAPVKPCDFILVMVFTKIFKYKSAGFFLNCKKNEPCNITTLLYKCDKLKT